MRTRTAGAKKASSTSGRLPRCRQCSVTQTGRANLPHFFPRRVSLDGEGVDLAFQLGRVYESIRSDTAGSKKVMTFRTLAEAKNWLGWKGRKGPAGDA